MSDSVKIWLRVLLAAAGVTLLALVSSPGGSTESGEKKEIGTTTIAACVAGEGVLRDLPGWPEKSIEAGPVGILDHPLKEMNREPDGALTTNMPILIEGHEKTTIAIVGPQRDRAALYYGADAGLPGEGPGFDRIRFHPCDDREHTVWPGGLRVEGPRAVRLKITVGDNEPFVIGLGRPKAAEVPKLPENQ